MTETQGRNLDAGTETEVMGGVLPSGLLITPCSTCFLISSGPPAQGQHHPGSAMISSENAPQTCPQTSPEELFLKWSSLFSSDSSLHQVDIRLTTTRAIRGKETCLFGRRVKKEMRCRHGWQKPKMRLGLAVALEMSSLTDKG